MPRPPLAPAAAALLLLAAGPAPAAPPRVPEKLAAEPGEPVRIDVEVEADGDLGMHPAWAADPKVQLVELRTPDAAKTRSFLFWTRKPGNYPVVFWTKGDTAGAVCVVTVAGPVPPGPAPPVPPGPNPPAPPVSPLARQLAAAFLAYPPPDRAERVASVMDLAELYRQAAVLAADDKTVGTLGELIARIHTARAALKIVGLDGVRGLIAEEVGRAFPVDGPLTPESRAQAAALFTLIAAALKEVK
jgi:hypothetical protein